MTLRVALQPGSGGGGTAAVRVISHTLTGLAAPHAFSVHRAKIMLWGQPGIAEPSPTDAGLDIALDWAPTTPYAVLRWVDAPAVAFTELVVKTVDYGPTPPWPRRPPRLVRSETELRNLSVKWQERGDHWAVFKHDFTITLALANQGRGLAITKYNGDNSPFSYGTSTRHAAPGAPRHT